MLLEGKRPRSSLMEVSVTKELPVPGVMADGQSLNDTTPSFHLSSFSIALMRDGREVLGVSLAEKLLEGLHWIGVDLSTTNSRIAVWILTLVGMSGVVSWAYYYGGKDLVSAVLPVGCAVALCVSFSFLCYRLGPPWDGFSPSSALITIVFVMEMTSFERFMIKTSLRTLGSISGGIVAVVWAEVSDLLGHNLFFMIGICFGVFLVDSVLAKLYKDVAYVFMIVSVTFSLVFFGYLQHGWTACWSRLISVFVGEGLAAFCIVVFSVASGEWHNSKSAKNIVKKTDMIFDKVIIAVDFAFVRNMISSLADESVDISQIKDYAVHAEVRDYFHLDTVNDLEELKSAAQASSFATFPVDMQVSQLQSECRSSWADMQLVRGVVPRILCGKQVFCELPNLGLIFDKVHPLYVQASALAHSVAVDSEVWQVEGPKLEDVRKHLQKVQEAWDKAFKLQIMTLNDTNAIAENTELLRDKFLACFKDISVALLAACSHLASVRKDMTSDVAKGVVHGDCPRQNPMWRFDAFCQSLDLIIAELCSLAMLSMKIMRVDDATKDDGGTMQTLLSIASVAPGDLDEIDVDMKPERLSSFLENLRNSEGPRRGWNRSFVQMMGSH